MAYELGKALDYDPWEKSDVIDSPTDPDSDYELGEAFDFDPFENDPRSSDQDEPDTEGRSLFDLPRLMGKGAAGVANVAAVANTIVNPIEWYGAAAGAVGDLTDSDTLKAQNKWIKTHGISAKLRQYGDEAERYYDEKLTPAMKKSMEKTILASAEEEGFFGEGATDPWKIGGMIAESIPSSMLSMGSGALITKGLINTGMKAAPKIVQGVIQRMIKKYGINAVAGVAGGAIGEGTYSGLDNAGQAYDEMMELPQKKLNKSKTYKEIYESLPDKLTSEQKRVYAQKILAFSTAGFIGSATAVSTGILGAPSGAFLGKLIGGEGGKSFWGNLIKGAITEGVFEEMPQSGIERIVTNTAKKFLVDPDQKILEGSGEAMAGGLIAGFAMGGGMAAVAGRAGSKPEEESDAKKILQGDGGPETTAKDVLQPDRNVEDTFEGDESIEADDEAAQFSEEELEAIPIDEDTEPPEITVKKQKELDIPITPEPQKERRAKPDRIAWDKPFRAIHTRAQNQTEREFVESAARLYVKKDPGFMDLATRLGKNIEPDTNVPEALKTIYGRIKSGMEPRKRTQEMSQGELKAALVTDHLTGLRNRHAFELEDKRKKHVASIDLDSLKYFNDTFGHQTGDEMLVNFGEALKPIDGSYHISGDEFIVQSDDSEALDDIMQNQIVKNLKKNPITVTMPDGKKVNYEVQFSYGKAETITDAESGLEKHKSAREAEGKRAARGDVPPSLLEKPAKGVSPEGERKGIPEAAVTPDKAIAAAIKDVDTAPTDAQKEAGNYKKAHVNVHGFDLTIENPKGSTRSGTSKAGKEWAIKMQHHYGYFKRTEGKDGDQIDTFIGDDLDSGKFFVVDQVDPDTGKFDEHKTLIGFKTEAAAKAGYLANYERGWKGLGAITEMDHATFKAWIDKGKQIKPVAGLEGAAPKKASPPEGAKTDNRKITIERLGDIGSKVRLKGGSGQKIQTITNIDPKSGKVSFDNGKTYHSTKTLEAVSPEEITLLDQKEIPAAKGTETKIITPGNRRGYNSAYVVVESDALIPSHNPNTFQKNQDYPEGIQERTYDTDRAEQEKVVNHAQRLSAPILLSDDPTPTNGPPIITPGGVVLGGNSRSMSVARAYKGGKADKYRKALISSAGKFGLDPATISKMERPVLVRRVFLEKGDIGTLHRIASDFNKSLTQGISLEAEIASMGKNISMPTTEKIGMRMANRDLSLRELLGKKDGIEILGWLMDDGVISATDENKFVNRKFALLNAPGKSMIEKAVMGSIIDDADLIAAAPRGLWNKLGRALPSLARIKARGDQWDITPEVKDALRLATEAHAADLSIRDHLSQGSLFGDKKEYNNTVVGLAELLADEKMIALSDRFKSFATDAMADIKDQGFLFEPKSFKDAFKDAFGIDVDERILPGAPAPAEQMSHSEFLDFVKQQNREGRKSSGIDYTETVEVEETGDKVKRKTDAAAYLNDLEDQQDAYEQLTKCMSGGS